MTREIVSYALEITWSDGTKEVRTDFPEIEYINEYLDELEREEGIPEIGSDEWLVNYENRRERYIQDGLVLIPDPNCSHCSEHNEYVCFICENYQIKNWEEAND